MNKFSDFDVKPATQSFAGEKIKIHKIFNVEITILDYLIEPSEYTEIRLRLSFKFKDEMRITFTSSKYLIDMIKKIPKEKFPFTTTIIKDVDDRYLFT